MVEKSLFSNRGRALGPTSYERRVTGTDRFLPHDRGTQTAEQFGLSGEEDENVFKICCRYRLQCGLLSVAVRRREEGRRRRMYEHGEEFKHNVLKEKEEERRSNTRRCDGGRGRQGTLKYQFFYL